jgi:hypothetical protein
MGLSKAYAFSKLLTSTGAPKKTRTQAALPSHFDTLIIPPEGNNVNRDKYPFFKINKYFIRP